MPIVKGNVKAIEVRLSACSNVSYKLLRGDASFFGCNHDGRAVRIVGTHKMDLVALHALRTNPNVCLDVFHDVTDVEIAIGIGQSGRDKKLSRGSIGI
jgi:hypothetical protein